MTNHFQLMVPCATTKDDVLNVHAPYDGALIATVDTADQQSVELALTTADSFISNKLSCYIKIAHRQCLTPFIR